MVLPDADLGRAVPALLGSAFGCAGQRCLAGSVLVAVGDKARQDAVVEAVVKGAQAMKLGSGFDPEASLCPLNAPEARDRVVRWIGKGVEEGATLLLDGRGAAPASHPHGCFVGPTIFDGVDPDTMSIAREEIFGPVIAIVRCATLDDAISTANKARFGNSASIFTTDGAAVRTFRSRIQCGMLGINLGVPAPFAAFSFRGWKESAFGVTGQHGADAVDFYTQKKVVTERWFGAEAPKGGWC
jgi:malonate-semialdehyde dehydrogenase (acetylating)/methylmalonate-semialdehyde dehydrogenase